MSKNTGEFLGISIDKHISVGHIITTAAAIVAAINAYANMQNRIENLEKADIRIEQSIAEKQDDYRKQLDRIYRSLEKISDKIDTKQDKK